MSVSFTLPLQSSWARMVRMLFRPFTLETWLVVGFAAFLSEYLAHLMGGHNSVDFDKQVPGPVKGMGQAVAAFFLNPVWGALAIVVTVCVTLALLALMWVSSRGRFVFLDDVVRERAAIVEPWSRYARHGNALFVFWLISAVCFLVVFVLVSLPLLPAILGAIAGGGWRMLGFMSIAGWVAVIIPLAILYGFTYLILFQFVVPIMYRDDLGVLAAWGRFLGLFRRHPVEFVAYGVVFLILKALVASVLLVVGIGTCCIGLVLFWLPYVGSVILLPLEVWFRGLGPDFLAQFGPDWALAAPPAPAPATPTPPTAGS